MKFSYLHIVLGQKNNTIIGRLLTLTTLLFLFPTISQAQQFTFSSNCQIAYQEIMALRLKSGMSYIQDEQKSNPSNYLTHLIADYNDLFTIFISESESELNKRLPNKEKRLRMLEKGDPNSPYYLYSQAEVNLHWAIARLKFEQYYKAFWEVRKAYKLLKTNQERFPNFKPNLKSLGIIHAFVGTIPDNYKWGVKILGLNGEVKQGMREVKSFLDYTKTNKRHFLEETEAIYAFLLIYLDNNPDKAWHIAQKLPTDNNLLNAFVKSDIAARTGRGQIAIQALQNRPQGDDYIEFHFLDYFLGTLLLNRLDATAKYPLQRFVNNFGGMHYIKDAYQKLAWHSLLFDNGTSYHSFMKKCQNQGATFVDADKQANKTAKNGKKPKAELLRARLLFDGGHYQRAYNELQQLSPNNLQQVHQLEMNYRYGRVCEKLGKKTEAIQYYQASIQAGYQSSEYFGPKSCLQLGLLYEDEGNKEKARTYYKKCFDFSGYEYENSIEQQAKAGLSRIKK